MKSHAWDETWHNFSRCCRSCSLSSPSLESSNHSRISPKVLGTPRPSQGPPEHPKPSALWKAPRFCPRDEAPLSSSIPSASLWLSSGKSIFPTQTLPFWPGPLGEYLSCTVCLASHQIISESRLCGKSARPDLAQSALTSLMFPQGHNVQSLPLSHRDFDSNILAVVFLLNLSFRDSFWVNPY